MLAKRLAAPALGALAAVALLATPASAHAVLLRTEPAPQTTVPRSPGVVRLFFSERVEVAFGAVRVFDVDGHRVDSGAVRHGTQPSEVDAPIPALKAGTYTVTWRAISADGHPVHGGFQFYVEHPSTISAVAVPSENGAGTFVGWGFGVVRFAWFAAVLALAGAMTVRRWVWTPALRAVAAGAPNASAQAAADQFRRWFRVLAPVSWGALAVATAASLVFQSAVVSGLPLNRAARWSVLTQVLHTAFGRIWRAKMVFGAALGLPVLALVRRRRLWGVPPGGWLALAGLLGGGLVVSAALDSHARTDPHPVVQVASLAVHLAAVGLWAGGLSVVVGLCRPAWRTLGDPERVAVVRGVVRRFSVLAAAGLAVVVATGVVNSIGSFGSITDLWRIEYGRVVMAKIALLAVAAGLAAWHRFVLPKRLAGSATAPGAAATFERSGRAEAVVLAGALALAAGLVVVTPGRTIALASTGQVNQERPAGQYTAQLFIDPSAVGSNEVHLTFVNAQGLAAGEVVNVTATLTPPGGRSAPVVLRLISPGHFVGDVTLLAPGRYSLAVSPGTGGGTVATFRFTLHGSRTRRASTREGANP